MRPTLINGRWPIILPDHRADFHEERPWWEAARLADMYAHLHDSGQALVDVGSEEGDLTALYASWGVWVYFIDPSAPWVEQTHDTFEANNLEPYGSHSGFADHETRPGHVIETPRFGVLEVESSVDRVSIDDLELMRVDALSIDVEGSELRVLRGAERTLAEQSPIVWVSIHEPCDFDARTPSKVHEYMRTLGYKDQFLAYDHEWHVRFYK